MSQVEGRATGGRGRRKEVAGSREVDPVPEVSGDGGAREVGFYERGKQSAKESLRQAADYGELRKTPYGLKPVAIVAALGMILSLDANIFTLAFPEIVRDLDIDVVTIIGIISIIGFFAIFLSVGLGWLADRVRRVPFVGIGAILSGIFSLGSAGSGNAWQMGMTRGSDAASGAVYDVPTFSLLADYYPPEDRGRAFALRAVLFNSVRIAAPAIVAGLAGATALAWRLPYLITGPLLIFAGTYALFALKEPIRGYMERRALGLSEEESRNAEEPVSFGEAWRSIWSIRTVRRLFIADIFQAPASFIFAVFFNVFLFEEYGLSILERGLIFGTGVGLVGIPFGLMAGGVIDVLFRRRPQRVLILTGALGVFAALFVAVMSLGPPLWVLIVVFAFLTGAFALVGPARNVFYVQILPGHLRTLGVQIRLLAEIPGTVVRTFIIAYAIDNFGTDGALFAAAPLFLLGAFVDLSAAGFFERDMRASLASQAASIDWRQAKRAGEGKLLVCRDVDVEYDGVQVLFGVDFDVEEGEMIALLGTNGAGKSTLLKAISGAHEASNGAVVFDGRDITHSPPHENAARGVVLMPGGRGIFPDLTVEDNLHLGAWLDSGDGSEGRMETVYRLFPVLEERRHERAQLLSGGEQQMLSLGQAFLSKPKLLMIDELSLGLAPQVVAQLVEIVRRINERGTTVIVVEQSVNVALTVAERAIFMEKGEVKFVGKTEELLRRPDILRAVYVKGSGALTDAGTASGQRSERERRRHEIEASRPILEVRSLCKGFGGVVAVDNVSFELREGEALGLIGPNGAGKTTVFDLISGYQIPDGGAIVLDGVDVTTDPAEARARQGLVRRFQDARLFPSLSVYENILVALEKQMEVRSMALHALQLPQARQAERRIRRRADRLIEILELGAYQDKFVKELSTGLRRITDIACVLATEPKVLLLDEPSTGIAQAESESLAPLLRRVRHETGCSMLVIEHDMPLISAIADELIAMDQGSVLMRGAPDDVLEDDRVIESYLGTSEDVIQRTDTRKRSKKKTTRSRA